MGITAQELALKISGDSASAQQAVQELVDSMSKLQIIAAHPIEFAKGFTEGVGAAIGQIPLMQQYGKEIEGIGVKTKEFGKQAAEAIEHPLQSAKTAMVSFVESMGPMSAGLLAIGTAVATAGVALYEFMSKAAEAGGRINDMSEKMSMSAEATSRLDYAMKIAGGSLEQASGVIFNLQRRLGEGGAATEKFGESLGRIGLKLADIQQMDADKQLYAISKGFQQSTDASNRAAVAMELFGRQGRDMIPLLMKDLGGLADEAHRLGYEWSETDAAAAEKFNMNVARLKEQFSQLATSIGKLLIPAFSILLGMLQKFIDTSSWIVEHTFGGWKKLYDYTKGILGEDALQSQTIAAHQDVINKAISLGADKAIQYGEALKFVDAQYGHGTLDSQKIMGDPEAWAKEEGRFKAAEAAAAAYKKQVADLVKTLQGHNDTSRAMVDALQIVAKDGLVLGTTEAKKFADAVDHLVAEGTPVPPMLLAQAAAAKAAQLDLDATAGVTKRLADIELELMNRTMALMPVQQDWWNLLPDAEGHINLLSHSLPQLGGDLVNLGADSGFAAQKTKELRDGLAALREKGTFGAAFLSDITGSLKTLPNLLVNAFTGGGGLAGAGKAIGAEIGGKLGTDVVTHFGEKIIGTLGKTLGGALTSILPGVGALVGPLVGKLFSAIKGIGGPGKDELSARGEAADFQKQFGSFQTMMDKVGDAYRNTGHGADDARQAVQKLLDATHKSAAAVQAAEAPIRAVLEREKAIAVGVGDVQKAFAAAGKHIPDDMKATIQTLLKMNGLTMDQKAALDAMAGGGQKDFASLTSMASGYGISLQQLGPKFEQANLDAAAKKIYDDFSDLKDAGADVGGVLSGMSTAISKLVQDSQKFGTAIPNNMKPLITELMKSGQLTDENGNKIEDVGALSFEDTPLDTSLQSLNATLLKLIDALNQIPGAAGAAANAIGSIPAPPSVGDYSGLVGARTEEFPSFDQRPMERVTHAGFALLHPGDYVGVPKPAKADTPAPAAPGNSYTIAPTIHALDVTGVEAYMRKKFLPALVKELRNGGGHLTDLKQVLS